MRRIIITREKCRFFAILASYWCVFNFSIDRIPSLRCTKEHDCIDCNEYCERISFSKGRLFVESSDETGKTEIIEPIQAIPIRNGKTVEIEMDDQEHEMFILFEAGLIVSNQIIIPAGCSDVSYSIQTNGGLVKTLNVIVSRTK